MKKRYLILAGLLVMTVAAAGCGKKKTTETAPVEVTATPTPEVTKAVDMVDMQQTADEDIKNIMGEKTSTASKIVFVNNTGDDIQSLYIRTHVDEDSEDYDADEDGGWGDDLINGMFTLTDKDKAPVISESALMQEKRRRPGTVQWKKKIWTGFLPARRWEIREPSERCWYLPVPVPCAEPLFCVPGQSLHPVPAW